MFFVANQEEKNLYKMNSFTPSEKFGYVPFSMEVFPSSNGKFDLKECFDFMPAMKNHSKFNNINDMIQLCDELFDLMRTFTNHLLKLISIYLYGDPHLLRELHSNIGNENNMTTLRSLYYPAVVDQGVSTWCSEHKDYGSITLLIQDENGGLQVETEYGKFIPVHPLENSIILNAADLLEIFSHGLIRSVLHRVVPNLQNKMRQSIAFFCNPNNNVEVKPHNLCNKHSINKITDKNVYSNKFSSSENVNTLDYLQKKISGTWSK